MTEKSSNTIESPQNIAEKRAEVIINWIKKHKILLVQTDSVKVELNIRGESVKGIVVTQFPE